MSAGGKCRQIVSSAPQKALPAPTARAKVGGGVKKLKVIPPMRCDVGCGECCGVVPATEKEFRAVQQFIAEHDIVPAPSLDGTCPLYQNGTCSVYPVRPLICRLFGHAADPDMTCPRGYNVNVPEREIVQRLRDNGRTTHVLHELAPNWEQIAHLIPRRGAPR